MKESMWGYWLVVLGISIMSVMVLLQNYTTTSEQDYFILKSVLEASMYDAVDYGYYRDTGTLKMNTEKFVENFVRRFSETVNINKNYQLQFYQIYEEPPVASVAIKTYTSDTNFGKDATENSENADVVNRLTGILYTNKSYQNIDDKIYSSVTDTPKTYSVVVNDGTNDLFSVSGVQYSEDKRTYTFESTKGTYTQLNCTRNGFNISVPFNHVKENIILEPDSRGRYSYAFDISVTGDIVCTAAGASV